MKKIILTFTFLIRITTKSKAQSQTYIDVLGGNKGLASEFFFLKPIDKQEKWLAISRSELHLADYKAEHPTFVNFNTFSYNFKNHIGVTAGTYAASQYKFSARLGLQYFIENEKYLFYANLSSSVLSNPDAQLLVIGNFTPKINEHWKFFSRVELRTAVNYKEGHAFSSQIVKLGLQYKNFIFGVGAEIEELNKSFGETEINIGPFLRLNFN